MIAHTLQQTATLYTTSRDRYGDQVATASTTIKCRFRWITELDQLGNREELRSDALLWTSPTEAVKEGTILKFEDDFFRVKRVTQARRLIGNKVEFIKCLLEKHTGGLDND